jgi:hypothetical protein
MDEYERGRVNLRLRGAAFNAAIEEGTSVSMFEDGA